jgi:hypothetical protein
VATFIQGGTFIPDSRVVSLSMFIGLHINFAKFFVYFQVNSEILETRISSSSKFVPQKNLSSNFKLNRKRFRNFKYFRTKYFQVLCPH